MILKKEAKPESRSVKRTDIQAQLCRFKRSSGNNFYNEKIAFVTFLNDRLAELIKKLNDIKHIIRCLSRLPDYAFINKLPFEYYVPKYKFCVPGTKIGKYLTLGGKEIK